MMDGTCKMDGTRNNNHDLTALSGSVFSEAFECATPEVYWRRWSRRSVFARSTAGRPSSDYYIDGSYRLRWSLFYLRTYQLSGSYFLSVVVLSRGPRPSCDCWFPSLFVIMVLIDRASRELSNGGRVVFLSNLDWTYLVKFYLVAKPDLALLITF